MPYLKMLWQTESPTPQVGSWDFWITKADDRPYNKHHTIKKVNNKICYYGSFIRDNSLQRDTLVISPDSDAVTMCHWHGTPVYTYTGTITDSNGIIWYYTHIPADLYNPSGESMIYDISSKRYGSNTQQAAQDLLDRIYAVPFHEDYQTGQTYTLTTTNLRRTIRKAIGTYLHRNTVRYREGYAYKLLSDDADNIIDLIITEITNKGSQEGLIYISIPGGALSFDIAVLHGTQGSIGQNTNQVPNATLTSQGVSYNYEHKYFRSDGYAQYSDVGAYPDWVTYVHIVTSTMSYETINAYSIQVDSIPYMAGLNLFSDMVSLTNLGIDL